MSIYFKEYLSRIFKRHAFEVVSFLFLLILVLFLTSIRSVFAIYAEGLMVILFLAVKFGKGKVFNPVHQNYRAVDILVLPVSGKEMFFAELIRSMLFMLPMYFIMAAILFSHIFEDISISFLMMFGYSVLGLITLSLFSIQGLFRINFKNLKRIHSFTNLTRAFLFGIIITLVCVLGFCLEDYLKIKEVSLAVYFMTLTSVIFSFIHYLEKFALNEHMIFNNKRFRWIDIPGTLLIIGLSMSIFMHKDHAARKPSSRSSVKIH
jgi:hypothetical protein